MAVFPLLQNPDSYQPQSWLLPTDAELQWYSDTTQQVMAALLEQVRFHADGDEKVARRIKALQTDFDAFVDGIMDTPAAGRGTWLLDAQVFKLLRQHGFHDPYAPLKYRETAQAAAIYPIRRERVDALRGDQVVVDLLKGLFAGNRFDMGCTEGIADYQENGADFDAAIATLKSRPWLVDDADAFADFFGHMPEAAREVLFFVDNAGADYVLGCLPMIRALARTGARVTVACNALPALNDITLAEALGITQRLAQDDAVLSSLLADGRIHFIDSGSKTILLNLAEVSPECAQWAARADLLVLHGMGRAIESNWPVRFTKPVLKVCLLKDSFIARRLGGEVLDIVCRFEP